MLPNGRFKVAPKSPQWCPKVASRSLQGRSKSTNSMNSIQWIPPPPSRFLPPTDASSSAHWCSADMAVHRAWALHWVFNSARGCWAFMGLHPHWCWAKGLFNICGLLLNPKFANGTALIGQDPVALGGWKQQALARRGGANPPHPHNASSVRQGGRTSSQ